MKKKGVLKLLPGELVEVKSEEEICAMLDKNGKYDGLTFLPEMRKFCGKKFKVLKPLEKMIIEGKGMRKIRNTVILDGAFCDGSSHYGCDRTCYCMWREAWLRRVEHEQKSKGTTLHAKRLDTTEKSCV